MSPYDYDHQDYVVPKAHLRNQRARVAWSKFRRRAEDQCGALVLLFALLLIVSVEVGVVSIVRAVQVFCWMLVVAFLLLLVEAATTLAREWRARGKR